MSLRTTAAKLDTHYAYRLDRITQAAKELSEATGQTCIATQADVRDPKLLQEAVAKTIAKFGKIDFVICGKPILVLTRALAKVTHDRTNTGAAGNFLAPISGLSENAFRTVIEIDTVG